MKKILHIGFAILALALPALAIAQTDTTASTAASTATAAIAAASANYVYQQNGVFGCSAGAYGQSPGSTAAIAGIYVPVSDATVELNTGILVYKECVLRGVVDKQRALATGQIDRAGISSFYTGRNGLPLYPQDLRADRVTESDRVEALGLQNSTLSTVNPAFKTQVARAEAVGYMRGTRASNQNFTCNYSGLATALTGRAQGSIWDALTAFQNPACNSYGAYSLVSSNFAAARGDALNTMLTKLGWNNGIYDRSTIDGGGNVITNTPGSIVGSNITQLLQSGYAQLQSANDIDQMVNALFAGISTRVVSDINGIGGLLTNTNQNGVQSSYFDQVLQQNQTDLRTSAINAALQILTSTRQVEQVYNQIVSSIVNSVTQAIATLRDREKVCWNLIISKVCADTPTASGTCTSSQATSTVLQIATSTAFSQPIVSSQLLPLASSSAQNLQASNQALSIINQLITTVTTSGDTNSQAAVVQRVDQLVAQRALHTQSDVASAQQSQSGIQSSLDNLIQNTLKAWGDSTDPSVGWCNVNNQAVLDLWTQRWTK